MIRMEEYEKQAENFLTETGTEFKAVFLKNDKYFDDDKETRDIYEITLKRGEREYKFRFGNSINNSGKYIVFTPDGRVICNQLDKKVFYRKYKRQMSRGDYRENEKFEEPTTYDVLACLQTYDVGTFEDFCSDFGYDTDSRKAEKTYKAVVDEYNNLKMLYSDKELEKLQEIN